MANSLEVINRKALCVCLRERESISALSGILSVYVGAPSEGLKERSIKLPHSLGLIKCVTCFTDEF